MDWKLELVFVPVSDVDRAKAFYVDQVGFHADHDQQVSEELRFVQLTPPGSACSIAFGTGLGVDMAPGSLRNLQVVVEDVAAARKQLIEHGVSGQRGGRAGVGVVRDLRRPGRQHLGAAAAPAAAGGVIVKDHPARAEAIGHAW